MSRILQSGSAGKSRWSMSLDLAGSCFLTHYKQPCQRGRFPCPSFGIAPIARQFTGLQDQQQLDPVSSAGTGSAVKWGLVLGGRCSWVCKPSRFVQYPRAGVYFTELAAEVGPKITSRRSALNRSRFSTPLRWRRQRAFDFHHNFERRGGGGPPYERGPSSGGGETDKTTRSAFQPAVVATAFFAAWPAVHSLLGSQLLLRDLRRE